MARDGVRVIVVSNDLGRIARGMQPKADKIVRKAALDIQAGMQTRAPVATGNLRASIRAERVGPAHWQVVVGADYGIYVEMGTRYMAAQPYARPTAAEVRPLFEQAMRQVVER